MKLSRFFPRGYLVRSYLIVIMPLGLLILAMTTMFFTSHVQEVNRRLALSLAQEMDVLISAANTDKDLYDLYQSAFTDANLMTARLLPDRFDSTDKHKCCTVLKDTLSDLPNPLSVERLEDLDTIRVSYQLDKQGASSGEWLIMEFPRKRAIMITAHIFIVWTLIFSIFLFLVAHGFLRNHVRSILNLADAADAFGRGEDVPNFKPSGAREVRKAARSVIRMRNRIRRYVDQRTQMLAGVSHDIRTPLTRLKLELALIKGTDLTAAKADIAEMERMLDGYLAFARGQEDEPTLDFDIIRVIKDAQTLASQRAEFELDMPDELIMRGRQHALKRAISNLANNAADHGDKIMITVTQAPGLVRIVVEDNGPGIPESKYNAALKPFGRLDAARNQNKSGVGLGLSITRDIVQSHGGAMKLGRSQIGGLSVTLNLPATSRKAS